MCSCVAILDIYTFPFVSKLVSYTLYVKLAMYSYLLNDYLVVFKLDRYIHSYMYPSNYVCVFSVASSYKTHEI